MAGVLSLPDAREEGEDRSPLRFVCCALLPVAYRLPELEVVPVHFTALGMPSS